MLISNIRRHINAWQCFSLEMFSAMNKEVGGKLALINEDEWNTRHGRQPSQQLAPGWHSYTSCTMLSSYFMLFDKPNYTWNVSLRQVHSFCLAIRIYSLFSAGYLFTPLGEIIYIVSLLNPEPLTVCLWEDRTIGLIAPYIGFPDVYENMQTWNSQLSHY